jgi:squalene-hopene/tetraprenyl-beta-curcumene cyclase
MKYTIVAALAVLVFTVVSFAVDTMPASRPASAPATSSAPASAPALPVVNKAAQPGSLEAAAVTAKSIDAAHAATAQKLLDGGVKYLLGTQSTDGSWSIATPAGPRFRAPLTAIALRALVQHPGISTKTPAVKKGFDVLLTYRQKDGGIYDPQEGVQNYSTAIAVTALTAAQDPQYKEVIADAVKFLRSLQVTPGAETPDKDVIGEDDPRVGGVNYGKKEFNRSGDLSNLSMWMDAMHAAGVSGEDPAMKRAVQFVSRLQNNSETNVAAAEGPNDGGFYYGLTESKAGKGPGGKGLRSYGSMTYAGFKSMLYAGVAKDDPRVVSAMQWIRTYWRLDSNPNLPEAQSLQGLYYYYQMFAKALRAWGADEIEDVQGVKHNWRHELIDALAKRAEPDGFWKNDADRWEEGSPILVTAYVVIALQEAVQQ